MKPKICPICGAEYTPKSNNSKYCSDKCRKIGRRISRKKWELETDYKEKQKEKAAQYRQEKKKQIQAAEQEKKKAKAKQEKREAPKKKTATNKQRRNIDEMISVLGKAGNTDIEYWKAFKDYIIEFAERSGNSSKTEVNGISVYNGDFEKLVVESIKEHKSISIG